MTRFTTAGNPALQGRARMAEIAVEDGEEIARITRQLIDSLDREPLPIEAIAAEAIATSSVKAARARQRGRDDTRQREILVELLKAAGVFGLQPLPNVQRASFLGPRQPGRRFYVAEKGEPFPPEPRAAEAQETRPNGMANGTPNADRT